ncbi:MAG: hypothetical protein ACM4D3_01060 [Candidatus Sericytochromatia bacterium]
MSGLKYKLVLALILTFTAATATGCMETFTFTGPDLPVTIP